MVGQSQPLSSDDAGESVRVPAVEGGEDDHLVGGAVRDTQLVTQPPEESCNNPAEFLQEEEKYYLSLDLSVLSSS